MSIEDLQRYSAVLDTLPNRDKICGFAAGKEELLSWEPSDLFQFYYDTTPIVGSLDTLLENIQRDDVPVSYTHLDVYKRQGLGRTAGRERRKRGLPSPRWKGNFGTSWIRISYENAARKLCKNAAQRWGWLSLLLPLSWASTERNMS